MKPLKETKMFFHFSLIFILEQSPNAKYSMQLFFAPQTDHMCCKNFAISFMKGCVEEMAQSQIVYIVDCTCVANGRSA